MRQVGATSKVGGRCAKGGGRCHVSRTRHLARSERRCGRRATMEVVGLFTEDVWARMSGRQVGVPNPGAPCVPERRVRGGHCFRRGILVGEKKATPHGRDGTILSRTPTIWAHLQ